MTVAIPSLASTDEIAKFAAHPRSLRAIEWRDAEGRLVAPSLAVTLQLTRGVGAWAMSIVIPADDAGALHDATGGQL